MFADCARTKQVWQQLELFDKLELEIMEANGLTHLLFLLLQSFLDAKVKLLCMSMWGIWVSRNITVLDKKEEGVDEVMARVATVLDGM